MLFTPSLRKECGTDFKLQLDNNEKKSRPTKLYSLKTFVSFVRTGNSKVYNQLIRKIGDFKLQQSMRIANNISILQ